MTTHAEFVERTQHIAKNMYDKAMSNTDNVSYHTFVGVMIGDSPDNPDSFSCITGIGGSGVNVVNALVALFEDHPALIKEVMTRLIAESLEKRILGMGDTNPVDLH